MFSTYICIYGTAQRQLESRGQTTHAVWNLYPRMRVRVQAHTHATSYLLRVISTNDKNTSLYRPQFFVSVFLFMYAYTHIVKSQSRTFLLCILVVISIVLTG